MSAVDRYSGILSGFAIARFAGWKMVFSLQAIVIAVTVSAAVGVFFDCIPRVAPRRSIRSRHCGRMNPSEASSRWCP